MAIVVVDYCKGNLRSVQKGIELAGYEAIISDAPATIVAADAIVLPGVGSFADASRTMCATGQMQTIRERLAQGVPFLGICLGQQLLFERGDEGVPSGTWAEGLGILRGNCRRVDDITPNGQKVKIPHVGWNSVEYVGEGVTPLFKGVPDGSYFYFTHSYQCDPSDRSDVLAQTTHATAFASAVQQGNIFGVQFHPEKSSEKGLIVMKNFVEIVRGRATLLQNDRSEDGSHEDHTASNHVTSKEKTA